MKIKVLIPKWNILGCQVLLKMVQEEKCEYYTEIVIMKGR